MPVLDHQRYRDLLVQARDAQSKSYARYSLQRKGAALLSASGDVYCGCIVEAASYAGSVCAEAAAFCHAVLKGERQFQVLALYPEGLPCGVCRQLMAEFNPDMELVTGEPESYRVFTLSQILPRNFGPHHLPETARPG